MKRNSHYVGEPALLQNRDSLRFDLPGTRRRATCTVVRRNWLALSIVLGFAFIIVFVLRGFPVHSDDGLGSGTDTFQSPLLIRKFSLRDESLLGTIESEPGNLLTNGYMDDPKLGFYWRYPNHWIAGGWFEWFSTAFRIPEFNDGSERYFYHSRPSSQRLQLWGGSYAGGLMQSIIVTPCTYYRFQAYGQSRPGASDPPSIDVASHMKVGIEPHGWMSGRSIYDYDPGLGLDEFPETVLWSAEATHNFTFAPYTVTAEALSNTVTVILSSNPEIYTAEGGVWWNDTVWDTASLVEAPPPSGTILDGTSLPQPDGLITNLSVLALPRAAVVEWDTPVPASSQILYRFAELGAPIPITEPLTYSLYLPLVANDFPTLDLYSSLDSTPVLHHKVVVAALPTEYTIDFAALSRRLDGQTCVTSASKIMHVASPDEGYVLYVPVALGGE